MFYRVVMMEGFGILEDQFEVIKVIYLISIMLFGNVFLELF